MQLLLNCLLNVYETLHSCSTQPADVYDGILLLSFFIGNLLIYLYSKVCVTRSLVLRVYFVDCCLYFFFWPLCCLYFFDWRFLITSLVSFQTLLLNICAYYNMYTKQFLELHFNVTPTCLLYYHRPRYTLSFFLFSTEFCLRRFDF